MPLSHATLRAVVGVALLPLIGCGEDAQNVSDDGNPAALSQRLPIPPDQWVDERSRTWTKVAKIDFSGAYARAERGKFDSAPNETGDTRLVPAQPPDLQKLTDEEIAAQFSPIMKWRGYEYELHGSERISFARALRTRARELAAEAPPALEKPADDVSDVQAADKGLIDGIDDRVRINAQAHLSPNDKIAAMNSPVLLPFTGYKLLNQFTMVTVAHGLYSMGGAGGTTWFPAADIQFAAGSGNTASSGTGMAQPTIPGVPSGVPDGSECYQTFVAAGWKTATTYSVAGGMQHDYGLIRLRGTDANCSLGSYDVGNYLYILREHTSSNDYGSLRLAGYPNAPPSGGWPSLFSDYGNGVHTTTNVFNHYIDTTSGNSGSPIATGTTSFGINCAENIPAAVNRGIRFNSAIIAWMDSLKGS